MVDFVSATQNGARQVTPADINAAFADTLAKAGAASMPRGGGVFGGEISAPTASFGGSKWLEAVINGTEAAGQIVSLSTSSNAGGVFGTRSSDNTATGAMSTFAIGVFAINDNANEPRPAYAIYGETRLSGTVNSVGQGMEMCVTNGHSVFTYQNSYTITESPCTIPLLLDAGRQDVPGTDSTVAMAIGGSGGVRDARFGVGISFLANCLRPNADGKYPAAQAVQMTSGMSLTWLNAVNGDVGSFVRADLGASLAGGALVFTGTGGVLQGPAGGSPFSWTDTLLATTAIHAFGDATIEGVANVVSGLTSHGPVSALSSLSVGGVLDVGLGINCHGPLGVGGACTFYAGATVNAVKAANDAAAGAAGVVLQGLYFNTTSSSLTLRQV